MIINYSSRIISNILLPEFDEFLKDSYDSGSYAVSQIMEHDDEFFEYEFLCGFVLSSGKLSFTINLYCENIRDTDKNRIIENFNNNFYKTKLVLSFIFKQNFNVVLLNEEKKENIQKSRIDISFNTGGDDSYLSIIIPVDLFRLFSYRQDKPDFEDIEKCVTDFFVNPENLFPDLKTVLNSLNEKDIQRLFYHLQKKNLLTPYQISLMLMSIPQHTVLIKRNLSSNIVKDVDNIIKKADVNKRDLTGGIYSIEEAIYMLMKSNEDFHYSRFFIELKNRLKIIFNTRTFASRDFYAWVSEMDKDDLYQVLSISKDEDIINSISDNPDSYYEIIKSSVSDRKIKELYSVFGEKRISFLARLESQGNIISHYKKIRIKKLNLGHNNFFALLTKIDRDEIIHLLYGVGWFILSTALKNTDKKKAIQLIEKLPTGAKYLIVDVLQGIVNPNIIHDEIQVNKARLACVEEMASLYEEGVINLLP